MDGACSSKKANDLPAPAVFSKMIQGLLCLQTIEMDACLVGSFPPDSTTWISDVDGFVWITRHPSELCESDELYLSWVRFTNSKGRHRVKASYWTKTDVQVVASNAIHIRWHDAPTIQTTRDLLSYPHRPTKQMCQTRFVRGSKVNCRRRLEFE